MTAWIAAVAVRRSSVRTGRDGVLIAAILSERTCGRPSGGAAVSRPENWA
jgi:hypothetical protein